MESGLEMAFASFVQYIRLVLGTPYKRELAYPPPPLPNQCLTMLSLLLSSVGAYHDKIAHNGLTMSDHMLFGSVVATILIVVVTAQVGEEIIISCFTVPEC